MSKHILTTRHNGKRTTSAVYNILQRYHTSEGYTITFSDGREDINIPANEFISIQGENFQEDLII